MLTSLTATTLPMAIQTLLTVNGYVVDGPLNVHGAEVDLRAVSNRSLFSETLYIEATIERVDIAKFGKDLTKLAMISREDSHARCLVVSTEGFTRDVIERANVLGITCLTFDDLRVKFERFKPYMDHVLNTGTTARELQQLTAAYQEPKLKSVRGQQPALSWLNEWVKYDKKHRWLVILGEYGTGKTALTKILQYRWCNEYLHDSSRPIPFRLELRSFNKVFDADGLLLHFMERNQLRDLTLSYVKSLIQDNRIILLLDGYDEMAQYMNVRERRACLQALAELSNDGARGIITSRPNYFTEAEELEVMEYLYVEAREVENEISEARHFVAEEKAVDALLESQFIERYEQTLEDLTTEQSFALVRRKLAHDIKGQKTVIALLSRVFRETGDDMRALSGKPVIVWYLLEVVDELTAAESAGASLSEWDIYSLIVTKLMYRDLKNRGPEVTPDQRRSFLRILAEFLSRREHTSIEQEEFEALVEQTWSRPVHLDADGYLEALKRRAVNLRSSTTLTKSESGESLQFSHNSLREFLLCERLLEKLEAKDQAPGLSIPVTDAMRTFVASRTSQDLDKFRQHLRARWDYEPRACSIWVNLLWEGVYATYMADPSRTTTTLEALTGSGHAVREARLARIRLSCNSEPQNLSKITFVDCELLDVSFEGADLSHAVFRDCWLDAVSFNHADLSKATFTGVLSDVALVDTKISGADFRQIDPDSTILLDREGIKVRYQGPSAIGYLRYAGALTSDIAARYIFMHQYPRFDILEKIVRKLSEQGARQRHGLTHKGISQKDPQFANAFIDFMINADFAIEVKASQLVSLTADGRDFASQFLQDLTLPSTFEQFLNNYL